MTSLFSHFPTKPASPTCENAFFILCNAHEASTSFLDIFTSIRTARAARGTPTDEEQDLLRAMLTFSTAGLDSLIKQLVREALSIVISKDIGAEEQFKNFVEGKISKDSEINNKLIADVLCSKTPRENLIGYLVKDLTANSLQSPDAILRAGSFFNIPSKDICSDIIKLKKIFHIRNQIIHEMDIRFDANNKSRHSRKRQEMLDATNLIFLVANNFLKEVNKRAV